jgi:hypothetical protein
MGDEESFVLCISDESQKVMADNSIKGERQLVTLLNSHEMRNPLNVVAKQCMTIKTLSE